MSQTLTPFEELLVGLTKANVLFITVGGIACVLNNHVRATEDVDILIKNTPENVKNLLNFLSTYGEGYGSELTQDDFIDEEGAIRVIELFPLDIFVVMAGNRYEDLLKLSTSTTIQNQKITFLKPKGLILLKENSVREKDKLDVLHFKSQAKKI